MTKTRTLITGGAGFIGYHLANALSQNSAQQIDLVDNFNRGEIDEELRQLTEKPNVSMINADLTDPATYDLLEKGYDAVYHLAAIVGVQNVMERPHEVLRINIMAALYLLEWMTKGGGKKLLLASTSEAYAWTQQFYELPVPTPEDVPLALTDLDNPRLTYAGSKIISEMAVHQYSAMFDFDYTIVRYHNVYGPRMGFSHVIPQLYYRALDGENPLTVYSVDHSRAFCFISDAITATIGVMENEAGNGQTFNIGNDTEEIAIGDLARLLLRTAGIDTPIDAHIAEYDAIKRRCPDITRIRQALGYEPQVPLEQGLAKTLDWYKKVYHDKH
jgi:UDP-glucose 4-epimerase